MVRWKEFWRGQKQSTETELNELNEEENSIFMATGLNTCLNPTFGIKAVKHGSDNLEGFLTAVEKTSSRRLSNAEVSNARTGRQVKSTKFFKE